MMFVVNKRTAGVDDGADAAAVACCECPVDGAGEGEEEDGDVVEVVVLLGDVAVEEGDEDE